MEKLTNGTIISFLTALFPDKVDGIWADYAGYSFSFNSDILAAEDITGTINGIEYSVFMGASKICFVLSGYDSVIKMPLNGLYDTYYNPETDEDYYEIVETLDVNDIDTEIDRYRSFSNSMKDFLLPNISVGTIKGIPIYKQEAIKETFSSFIHRNRNIKLKPNSRQIISEIRDKGIDPGFPNIFISDIIKDYPNVYDNILKESEKIRDVHYENIGYTYDGRAVCFDYAI